MSLFRVLSDFLKPTRRYSGFHNRTVSIAATQYTILSFIDLAIYILQYHNLSFVIFGHRSFGCLVMSQGLDRFLNDMYSPSHLDGVCSFKT